MSNKSITINLRKIAQESGVQTTTQQMNMLPYIKYIYAYLYVCMYVAACS